MDLHNLNVVPHFQDGRFAHVGSFILQTKQGKKKVLSQRAAKLKAGPPRGLEVQLICDGPLSPALTHSHPSARARIQTN